MSHKERKKKKEKEVASARDFKTYQNFFATPQSSFSDTYKLKFRESIPDDTIYLARSELDDSYQWSRQHPHPIMYIDISHNGFTFIPPSLQIDEVMRLLCGNNKIAEFQVGKSLEHLSHLDLSNNILRMFPSAHALACLPNIKILNLMGNQISEIPEESIKSLIKCSLTYLNISSNNLHCIPSCICDLGSLQCLYLGSNHLAANLVSLLESLTWTTGLEVLDLSSNKIIALPSQIGALSSLVELNLSNNDIRWLPREITNLERLTESLDAFNISGNASLDKDQYLSLCDNGLDALKDFFLSREAAPSGCTKAHHLKLIMVGHKDAGKTQLFKKLVVGTDAQVRNAEFHNYTVNQELIKKARTVCNVPVPDELNDLCINIWDLAGNDYFHSSHEIFFSECALHLVVWNMTKHDLSDIDTYVQYWIDLIQARAPHSSIIVVATHADAFTDMTQRGTIVTKLRDRLSANECTRIEELIFDIDKCTNENSKSVLKTLLRERFGIVYENYSKVASGELRSLSNNLRSVKGIVALGSDEIDELAVEIVKLATPSSTNPLPFSIINKELLSAHHVVKAVIDELKRNAGQQQFCTIEELTSILQSFVKATLDGSATSPIPGLGQFSSSRQFSSGSKSAKSPVVMIEKDTAPYTPTRSNSKSAKVGHQKHFSKGASSFAEVNQSPAVGSEKSTPRITKAHSGSSTPVLALDKSVFVGLPRKVLEDILHNSLRKVKLAVAYWAEVGEVRMDYLFLQF
jgi:GTPase SAR1 family protein